MSCHVVFLLRLSPCHRLPPAAASNEIPPRPRRLNHVPKRLSSPPPQEADDRLLQPAEDVRRDEGQLATRQGAVVRRRVLPLAHRQQRHPLAVCAGTWMMQRELKKK